MKKKRVDQDQRKSIKKGDKLRQKMKKILIQVKSSRTKIISLHMAVEVKVERERLRYLLIDQDREP
jgi:ASC-1-like (ASCH) protein